MKKVSLDTWIQLLGMVGLLGGLIFVGLEMKQSQLIALAAQQQARVDTFTNFTNSLTEAGISNRQLLAMASGRIEVTEEYEAALDNMAHFTWWVYENDFLQYTLGLMDEEIWAAKLRPLQAMYNSCSIRQTWNGRRNGLDKRFVALVESFPDECTE